MKFMYHSASFGCFLFLLFLVSTNVSADEADRMKRQNLRGPAPSILELCVVLYVVGNCIDTFVLMSHSSHMHLLYVLCMMTQPPADVIRCHVDVC